MRSLMCTCALLLAVSVAPGASASTITLSKYSSGMTSPSVLDALLEFSITGGGTELTLAVFNDTTAPNDFDMNHVFFNVLDTSSATGLVLTSPTIGWEVILDKHVDGFGQFDICLKDGVGVDPHKIAPGETGIFTFDIQGTGPFHDTDFSTELTDISPGNTPALAAAKFVDGPCGNSAFGATDVPEPASLVLAAVGGLGMLRTRRR
ncbi:MAG: PEP-CTERM sorting domain-containing protein [Planctomycetota bacterium]